MSEDAPWRDKETLERLYHSEGLTTKEMSKELDCGQATIVRWMQKLGVEAESNEVLSKEGPWNDESELRKLHHEKGLSVNQISDQWNTSRYVVKKALEKNDIERKYTSIGWKFDCVSFYTGSGGYECWKDRAGYIRVHRLLAIAEGHDPHRIFSGEVDVHHKTRIPWDNRPESIEVIDRSEHGSQHSEEWAKSQRAYDRGYTPKERCVKWREMAKGEKSLDRIVENSPRTKSCIHRHVTGGCTHDNTGETPPLEYDWSIQRWATSA